MSTQLLVQDQIDWSDRGIEDYSMFLAVDNVVVAYAHLLHHPHYGENVFCLCAVEVREGYRGKGYARQIMTLIEEKKGYSLATTGSYTPEGFEAFNGKLPLLPEGVDHGRATFGSMSFIKDWDIHDAVAQSAEEYMDEVIDA
ncbi:MAG: GNAT family N-acetyltransferase [Enterococcus sp.]|nr:GNAT family N-acetyltransferase [Enterococcus sp.]